jgi:hypothetical protein
LTKISSHGGPSPEPWFHKIILAQLNEPKTVSEIAANLNAPPAQVARSIKKLMADFCKIDLFPAMAGKSFPSTLDHQNHLSGNLEENTWLDLVESVKRAIKARLIVEKPGVRQSDCLFKTTDDDF